MANWWESLFGGGDEDEYKFAEPPAPKFYEQPEYPEAAGARGEWWKRLQQWGGEEGYGAISPNFGDIWERAKKRVSQYYWGGPEGGTGIAGKIKASAARRGVSESPALETMMGRMGATEAGQLGDISTELATKEAEFGERGRQSWLENIMRLSGMQMPGTWQGAQGYQPAQTTPWGDLASSIGSYFGGGGEFNLQKIYDMFGDVGKKKQPTVAQESLTGGPLGYEDYA